MLLNAKARAGRPPKRRHLWLFAWLSFFPWRDPVPAPVSVFVREFGCFCLCACPTLRAPCASKSSGVACLGARPNRIFSLEGNPAYPKPCLLWMDQIPSHHEMKPWLKPLLAFTKGSKHFSSCAKWISQPSTVSLTSASLSCARAEATASPRSRRTSTSPPGPRRA